MDGIRLEDDAAAVTAVAPVRAAAGHELLTPEADAARAPVAALDEDVDLVDEHGMTDSGRAGPAQAGCWAMLTYLSSPLRSKRT